ncbi:NAD(P)/FAD-dependent oxidoreductase [Nocardia transvalensis]|uniref:NAD(P)/FAD-dependent oxidoreductase n=1 Tax=Nocardia transvalensis TaxID=37333 RepID=UPI001892EBA4|nr:FAD-dependent oxidoreductase [Nocardia transvalensis]MBF6332187.1 FAD-dependent oxidoreductase [Nocardia transvalensis]
MNPVVVVGASLAGFSVVRALREYGHRDPITVIGAEEYPPYDRPPLSKEFLHGDVDLSLARPDDGLDLRTHWLLGRRATGLLAGRGVTLEDGTEIAGESVVLATGARARTLPSAGTLQGVHTLRTVDDARAIRAALGTARTLVVIGAGLIGSEIASTAIGFGTDVTIVDISAEPLAAIFGPQIGALCANLHAANGVRLRTGVAVTEFVGTERVRAVRLTDGSELPADAVVIGIGAVPNTEWARESGIAIDNGFLTDEYCRTSLPGTYAIGDCARSYLPALGAHHRSEHWTNATAQARIAAATIAGVPPQHSALPYFWSRQYGRMIQFAGACRPTDTVHFVDGDPSAPSCTALYERDGAPVAVFALDNPRRFIRYRKQLERQPAPAAAP